MAVDPGNPRRFLRATKWKKAMDGFFHGQLDEGHEHDGVVVVVEGVEVAVVWAEHARACGVGIHRCGSLLIHSTIGAEGNQMVGKAL